MGFSLVLLILCAVDEQPPSIASNPQRRVRLHVDTEDSSLRIIDATSGEIVCYGTCDEALPADRPYRTLELDTLKTHEFTLSEIKQEAIFQPVRHTKLLVAGVVIMGIGAATFYAGAIVFLLGWFASGNGLSSNSRWTVPLANGGLVTAGIGIPIVVIGLPFALLGLRRGYEISERVPPQVLAP